jgi:hypothetical protein
VNATYTLSENALGGVFRAGKLLICLVIFADSSSSHLNEIQVKSRLGASAGRVRYAQNILQLTYLSGTILQ